MNAIAYAGAESAVPSSAAIAALRDPDLEVIVNCPSNPWPSVAPILSMPALRQAVRASARPVVSVSPLVAGTAVKGPTAKLMRELGFDVTAKLGSRSYPRSQPRPRSRDNSTERLAGLRNVHSHDGRSVEMQFSEASPLFWRQSQPRRVVSAELQLGKWRRPRQRNRPAWIQIDGILWPRCSAVLHKALTFLQACI